MANIGKVFITGLIGNDYDEQGNVSEKGVELIDVVEQVAALGEKDEYHFLIKSQGGNVNIGKDIGAFIGAMDNAFTIATELCASIATIIHTSVPLQNRSIEEGTKYMIHNPWGSVTGDANVMEQAAKAFQDVEKDLELHYAKATGTKKETISAFMASETFLTPEQCVNLKFASQIIPKPTLRAVAKLQTKNKNMSGFTDRINNAIAALKGEAIPNPTPEPSREAKAVMIETDKGTVETPFEDVLVGDPVMIEGAPAENGDYTIENGEFLSLDGQMISTGTVITVTDGLVSAIEAGVTEDAENLATLQARITELEASAETAAAAKVTDDAALSTATEQLEALAAMGSKAVIPQAQARHRKVETVKAGVTKGGIDAILNKKKN